MAAVSAFVTSNPAGAIRIGLIYAAVLATIPAVMYTHANPVVCVIVAAVTTLYAVANVANYGLPRELVESLPLICFAGVVISIAVGTGQPDGNNPVPKDIGMPLLFGLLTMISLSFLTVGRPQINCHAVGADDCQ